MLSCVQLCDSGPKPTSLNSSALGGGFFTTSATWEAPLSCVSVLLILLVLAFTFMGFTDGSDGKESACNVENPVSIPGSGRSPGEGNSCPLQYSYLENSMDRGPGRLQSMGLQRVRHEWETNTFTLYRMALFMFCPLQAL
ncbi:unnamed protein product [Rangifer tarandus platyrhynchus]|uniref:Uncharacterized protein n=2 Tax=Rangifer tarandus platyrhynchus TaxID=3082113 RepID=A0AC59YS51_RANTA|nr:unnamed protein product [Rangifer tarandus platyrhynchus]